MDYAPQPPRLVDVGAVRRDERVDHRLVVCVRGGIQRRASVLCRPVHVGSPRGDQRVDHGLVTPPRRHVERRRAVLVGLIHVGARSVAMAQVEFEAKSRGEESIFKPFFFLF